MAVGLLCAVRGAAETLVVQAAEASSGRLAVTRRCADLTELLAAAEAGLGRVAVVSAETERLDDILQRHEVPMDPHKDQAMEALINETNKMISLVEGDELRDAALIGSMQRLEHYQIAAYGTAAALAGQLELHGDEKMLHFAKLHRDVIARFGRFPHRNAILGRAPRPDEIAAGDVVPW